MVKDIKLDLLDSALSRLRDGVDPSIIELPESAVFPGLIPAAPATARKSRVTGILLGNTAPRYVKRGHRVYYRLSDVLEWIRSAEAVQSTAQAFLHRHLEEE